MSVAAIFDRSLKALIREFPAAFFRLAGLDLTGLRVRLGDAAVNLPEFRADNVFVVEGQRAADRFGLQIEYQLQPSRGVLTDWFLKNAGLTRQLRMPVFLVVVYLTRGKRRQFPDRYSIARGALENEYRFHTIRLWEHAERIRSGELPELAPLLVLCEDEPGEAVIEEERGLIRSLDVSSRARGDLLAIAVAVGSRYFSRELLFEVFKEELAMLKEAGIIEDWVEEGVERGRVLGREQEARSFLRRQLEEKFGPLSAERTKRINQADAEWCRELGVKLIHARTLEELGL